MITPRFSLAVSCLLALGVGTAFNLHAAGADASPRIIGGVDVPDGGYTFMSSLQSRSGDHYCGAALISPRWAITAAHCVQGERPADLRLVVGRTVLSDTSQGKRSTIREIHIHPNYLRAGSHDVALLRLGSAHPRVKPIQLVAAGSSEYEQDGRLLTNIGWGNIVQQPDPDGGYELPDRLRQVQLPYVDFQACKAAYAQMPNYPELLAGSELCAGQAGKDACQGDSGGPLFVDTPDRGWTLLGLVSHGWGCGAPGYPGVFARLADESTAAFIEQVWTRD